MNGDLMNNSRVVQDLRNKAGITEEIEKKINQMVSGTLGVGYSEDYSTPVTNGYGKLTLGPYSNPFPWKITVHATGWVTSPVNGTWRILITSNGKTIFDQSGIKVNQKFSASTSVDGWSSASIVVEAWWSEKTNTTLKVHVDASI